MKIDNYTVLSKFFLQKEIHIIFKDYLNLKGNKGIHIHIKQFYLHEIVNSPFDLHRLSISLLIDEESIVISSLHCLCPCY